MNFVPIKGFRGGNLSYVREEKNLYLPKTKTKTGQSYLVCYDTILMKNEKRENPNFKDCPARCVVDEATGLLRCTVSHHREHGNHESIFNDLISLNGMKDRCRYLAAQYPFSARKIPVKDIFLAEMAK